MTLTQIRFGGYQGQASVHTRAARHFGEVLTARLGDAVRFELTASVIEQGRKAADLLPMVESGELTMCYFSTSYLAGRVPTAGLLDLPFAIADRAQAYALFDGAFGARLADDMAACTNYRLLGVWDNGIRHLSNRARAIRRPEDCRGLSLRTLNNDFHIRVFKQLGFDARFLDVGDLIPAIRNGTIDGQENPLTNIYNFGIHEYHRYITLTGHFFGAAGLLCNKEAYAAWPDPVRDAVAEAAAAATAEQRRLATAEDEDVMAKLSPETNEVIRLTDDERAAFREAVAPLVAEQRAQFDADVLACLDAAV